MGFFLHQYLLEIKQVNSQDIQNILYGVQVKNYCTISECIIMDKFINSEIINGEKFFKYLEKT